MLLPSTLLQRVVFSVSSACFCRCCFAAIMVICVECAAPVSCVYRRFPSSSPENIRLQRCDACGATADKYVEYEGLLLFVELVLHKPQTYRHILFNRLPYADAGLPAPLYRLAAACILFDAYTIWFLLHVDHARFLYTSAEEGGGEGGHTREEQVEQYPQHQPLSQQAEKPQLRLQQRSHRQQQRDTQQHFEHQNRDENQVRQAPLPCSHGGENSQRAVSAVCGSSIDSVCTVGEPLMTVDPSASSRSRCCRLYFVSDGAVSPATWTLSVGASPVDAAPALHSTAAHDSVGTTAAASAGAPPASVCVLMGSLAAAAELPPDSEPSGAAVSPSRHAVVVQQDEETGDRPGSFAASSPGNFYFAESQGRAATTSKYPRPEAATMPSPTRRHPVAAATAAASQPAPASWSEATDAQRHADMVRWLLHNPVVSVDQQLLILSVSIVDFLVYIFAIIFFTDLFLRFSFRRRRTQKRQPPQQPRGAVSSVCTPEAAAAACRIASPLCSCHTLAGVAGGRGSQWRVRAPEGRGHFAYAERHRETRAGEGETRQRQEGEEWHVWTEENRRHAESSVQQRADDAEEREKLVQQDAEGLTAGRRREAGVSQEDGGTAFGTRFDAEEKEQRREGEVEPTQKQTQDRGSLVSGETSDPKSKGSCLGEKAWAAMSSGGNGCSVEASSRLSWTQGSSFLSSLWHFSVLSGRTAARELLSLLFGCENHEGDAAAAAAAEGRGVVLIKYNYLAAAVTLSMFGKLGALVLMAWEESLSPRFFTSLFTLTSNVLAVDVFLNSQHHAGAASIVAAAAVVRAFARLAEQLAFPSVAFPPCAILTAAEIGNAEQLSPLLSFIALLL